VHLGPRSSYRFFERHPDGRARQLASIPTASPCYLHSFAITDRHIVFVEQPLRVRPLDLVMSAKPFIEQYRWQPELGSTFVVLDRDTGVVRRRHQGPALFVFHHVNAFDDGEDVVIDLCAYDDPSIIDALYLDSAGRLAAATLPTATLTRFRLTPGRDAQAQPLCDTPLEWPRVAERVDGRPYEAAYGAGATYERGVLQASITKCDPRSREVLHHHWDGCLPGEPVVVSRPTGAAEHDGVVLSVVFDPARGRSFVGVLDARTLEEIAQVHAPVRVPFGFHGDFFPAA
jgi:carotenoid cleavage dioxygenase-like enzyme